MSAVQRFHEAANDALVKLSEHCLPGAKLALVIYTPGEPERDIVIEDQGLDKNEVVSALRRRGLSIDGDNDYKADLCDSIVGALAFGKQNTNPPPADHWGQQFWEIGRAEGELQEEMETLLRRLVQWDLDYPVNCYDGYAGLKALNQIIADAKTVIAKTPA
ncbi:hypothetical protein [Pseudomonas sp. HLS-6]|uniref:hypothetical protein n=1 Tax=Pseudomonas sp. HLS-6 TaxID=2049589 RepID=UPI002114C4FC|nr:hypothetical protein [Pseudomonas sp. HLS-6]